MAIAVVNRANFTNAVPASSFIFTLPFVPTNGNTLILTASYTGLNPNTLSSITETGATWVLVTQAANNHIPGNIERHGIWYANNVSGAGTGLTFTFAGSVDSIIVHVTEYSGISTATALDTFFSASCNVGFPDASCGPILDTGSTPPTANPAEVFVAVIGQHGTDTFSAPTNNFVLVHQDTAGTITSAYLENIVGSILPADVSVTSTNFGNTVTSNWSGAIATFIAAPTPPPPPSLLFPINRLVSDYIDDLRNRFAEINFSTWVPDQQLIDFLNLAVEDICFRTLPPRYEVYPPLQFNSVGGQVAYDLPPNFFRVKEFGDTSGLFFNGDPLLFEDKTAEYEEALFENLLVNSSQPVWFWFWSNKVFIYPPANDTTGIIKMYYYRLPNFARFLTDYVDIDRPWEEIVIKFVCWKVLEKDKHPMAQVYRQEYEQALSNKYSESRIRAEKRARYVHSHDFWGRDGR